jgi:hypothetical protein
LEGYSADAARKHGADEDVTRRAHGSDGARQKAQKGCEEKARKRA